MRERDRYRDRGTEREVQSETDRLQDRQAYIKTDREQTKRDRDHTKRDIDRKRDTVRLRQKKSCQMLSKF